MSQDGNGSNNDIIRTLTLYASVDQFFLSGNVQSEHVAAVETIKTKILLEA